MTYKKNVSWEKLWGLLSYNPTATNKLLFTNVKKDGDKRLYRFEYSEQVAKLFGQDFDNTGRYPYKISLVDIFNGKPEYFYFTDFASMLEEHHIHIVSHSELSKQIVNSLFDTTYLITESIKQNKTIFSYQLLDETLRIKFENETHFKVKPKSTLSKLLFGDNTVSNYISPTPIIIYALIKELV